MSYDATEVRKALTIHAYFADVGTAMPTDVTTPLSGAWGHAGYTDPDGINWSPDRSYESHTPHQSRRAIRRDLTEAEDTISITLWQRNAFNTKLAMGGGVVAAGTNGATVFTPPVVPDSNQRAMILEVEDGDVTDRHCYDLVDVGLDGDISFSKSEITAYELSVMLLDPDGTGGYTMITNDPAVPAD